MSISFCMSDRILLIIMAVCLLIGGYKLVSRSPSETKETAPKTASPAVDSAKTDSGSATPQPHIAPPPPLEKASSVITPAPAVNIPKPATGKNAAPETPPKISTKELRKRYHVEGIAQGSSGTMVMINQTPLKEGDTLGELKIEKIGQNHIDVIFQGQSYHLRAEVF
ncbi:hypothetical protein EGM51_10080 [Verrucomicrobia bacterium S94]|nr:hypothetical protein EGM51_10080 [Verrucomicrobia bacterium S94]